MSSLTNQYINKLIPNTTIMLLIGSTGAGKSTFFNFLCGAEFVSNGIELELKYPSDQFSKMQGGSVSVTKEPKFYMNSSNNHLLIDFPGFQDTTGDSEQLLFDLLFNKIVSMGEVKILYVIKNPDNCLPTRGSDLQRFIQQFDNPNFNLLLNCYLEDFGDQELINLIKKELEQAKILTNIDQILVQRKAKKSNLGEHFNNKHKQNCWNQINLMKNVQIKPINIPKSQLISEFMMFQTTKQIQEYGNIMLNFFNQKTNESTQQMLVNLKIFQELMKNENSFSALKWFEEFIKICEKLTNSDNSKSPICQDFMEVFKYFEQFKEFINGYSQLQTINQIAKQNLKQIEILVDSKIELIEKLKQAEQEKQKAEQEKQKAEQERQKAEQERQKAEQERQKAEQERQKAEQERQKAEQDKQREIERLNRQYQQQERKYKAEQAEFQRKQLEEQSNEKKKREKEIEENEIKKPKNDKPKQEQESEEIDKLELEKRMKENTEKYVKKNNLILRLQDNHRKILDLEYRKVQYMSGQRGIFQAIFGDNQQVFEKKISEFDDQINELIEWKEEQLKILRKL